MNTLAMDIKVMRVTFFKARNIKSPTKRVVVEFTPANTPDFYTVTSNTLMLRAYDELATKVGPKWLRCQETDYIR